jgi:hypothetical protein
MSIDAEQKERLLAEARGYYDDLDENQLERLLAKEWARAEQTAMPMRSDESPGVQIMHTLKDSLAANPAVTTATVEYVAFLVLDYFETAGYDLSAFHIPIAVIIAYIVQTVLKKWKRERKEERKKQKVKDEKRAKQ